MKVLETLLTSKIGISRSYLISNGSEDFRAFSYVIWWTEYEKNTGKNHWGVLDLENLQSRSHFIFCIRERWRWLYSVIDGPKLGKTVKKNPQRIFDLEIEIFKVKGVCVNFFTISYVFSASNYIRKPSKNLAYIRNKIWPWIGDFQGQVCLREFFYYFFHIQRVKLHRNTLSNLHDEWDKFFTLHFTLPAGLVDISTSSQVGDST